MSDDKDDDLAQSPAARLAQGMAGLASGLVPPEGKPMSAVELSELRSLMATGKYQPVQSQAASPSPTAATTPQPENPLSASEISAVRAMMAVRPYVPNPMPGDAAPRDASGSVQDGKGKGQKADK